MYLCRSRLSILDCGNNISTKSTKQIVSQTTHEMSIKIIELFSPKVMIIFFANCMCLLKK